MGFDVNLWAKIRAEYESGKYSSYEDLHEKLSKNYQDFPKLSHLIRRGSIEGWNKQEVANSLKEKYREAFIKRGFDIEQVVEVVSVMSMANRPIVSNGEIVADAEDWCARDKAITQYAKLTGSYAPEQRENVTPEKLKRFILKAGEIIAKYVSEDKKEDCLKEISFLMELFDNEV